MTEQEASAPDKPAALNAAQSGAARSGLAGRILQGDCLEQVPLLAEEGKFQLIYADPPYNAGGMRSARLGAGQRATGASAYRDAWGGLEGFLNMMKPRLEILVQALKPEGTLWIHLDQRTVHDVKVLLDQIMGRGHFLGEVIWIPGNGSRGSRGPAMTHQTILIYGASQDYYYDIRSPSLREPYAKTSLSMHFKQEDEAGRLYREKKVGAKVYRYYADEGRKLGSVWADCPAMLANTPLRRETTGYPTQKPEALLERIIAVASRPGDRVLDPMFGSGTTLAVAHRLGRAWAGCDQSELAVSTASARLLAQGAALLDPQLR